METVGIEPCVELESTSLVYKTSASPYMLTRQIIQRQHFVQGEGIEPSSRGSKPRVFAVRQNPEWSTGEDSNLYHLVSETSVPPIELPVNGAVRGDRTRCLSLTKRARYPQRMDGKSGFDRTRTCIAFQPRLKVG